LSIFEYHWSSPVVNRGEPNKAVGELPIGQGY